jgi:mono/diheme cytochrome c family protein
VFVVVAAILAFGVSARGPVATADEPKTADEKVPTYTNDVAPLLKTACANCHTGAKAKKKIDVSSYDKVMKIVKANEPDKSVLVKSVTGKGAKLMPPKKGLSDAQVATLKAWIVAGAKND